MDGSIEKMTVSGSLVNLGKKMASSSSSSQESNKLPIQNPIVQQPEPNGHKMVRTNDLAPNKATDTDTDRDTNRDTDSNSNADMDALSGNKVGVEIEPDVKSNVVNLNMCSFVFSWNCLTFSKIAKTD